jgi:hypothetical protein
MSKAKTKAAPDTEQTGEAPVAKKRSKLMLALFALVPLVLAGGGYAGWTVFLAPASATDAHAASGHDGGEADMMEVASISPEIRAETSATQTYALSVLIADTCGAPAAPALKAASEAEAHADAALVNLSWIAAVRRTRGLTEKTCGYLWSEIEDAEAKLAHASAPAKGGHGAKETGGHGKPAH